MKSRLTTVFLVLGLLAFGACGAYAGAATLGIVHGQAHAQHGKALSHGKKHGLKHHSKALCASKIKNHGRKHRAKTLCHTKKHGLKPNAPSVSGSVDSSRSSAVAQYGTRPGKGCGDRNHVHTGPPGNPSNTQCPPQSHHG
ncbi:MAG: hypothetical protein JWO21_1212 [Solirubrobacterales bacterium]|jgi:hypothetical protein|nr:hypothetical protein [Solirubrobacterales bacterium]